MRRLIALASVAAVLVFGGCDDPHKCGPDDVDHDKDGICHES